MTDLHECLYPCRPGPTSIIFSGSVKSNRNWCESTNQEWERWPNVWMSTVLNARYYYTPCPVCLLLLDNLLGYRGPTTVKSVVPWAPGALYGSRSTYKVTQYTNIHHDNCWHPLDEKSPVPVNHGRPSNSNVGDINMYNKLCWRVVCNPYISAKSSSHLNVGY